MNASGLSSPNLPPILLALGAQGQALLEVATQEIPDEIGSQAMTASPWNPQRDDEIAELEREAATALAHGEAWLDSIADHPWMRPFTPTQQGWVRGAERRSPTSELFKPPGVQTPRWQDLDLMPENGALGTTTTLVDDNLGPIPDEFRSPEGAPVWRLLMVESARVRDLRTSEDWSGLVTAYPRLISETDLAVENSGIRIPGPVYGVDWAAASADLDGVRLTLEGLVRIPYVETRVLDGTTTFVLGDVAWEHTLWLRWMVAETVTVREPQ
ncbi:MAG: hypothetical protein R2878_03100 [Thermoleophilia bacterium]